MLQVCRLGHGGKKNLLPPPSSPSLLFPTSGQRSRKDRGSPSQGLSQRPGQLLPLCRASNGPSLGSVLRSVALVKARCPERAGCERARQDGSAGDQSRGRDEVSEPRAGLGLSERLWQEAEHAQTPPHVSGDRSSPASVTGRCRWFSGKVPLSAGRAPASASGTGRGRISRGTRRRGQVQNRQLGLGRLRGSLCAGLSP